MYKNVNIHKGIYMSELVHKFSQLSCLQLHLDQRGQHWKYHNENRGSIPREVAIFIIALRHVRVLSPWNAKGRLRSKTRRIGGSRVRTHRRPVPAAQREQHQRCRRPPRPPPMDTHNMFLDRRLQGTGGRLHWPDDMRSAWSQGSGSFGSDI